MENHPIPQDVTGFKFRLIGSMTVKQFLYVLGGGALALLIYILPINFYIRLPLVLLFGGFGAALAFIPVEGRPMDIMVKNFLKALPAENQFIYRKKGAEALIMSYFTPPPAVKTQKPEEDETESELKRKRALLKKELKLGSRYKPDKTELKMISNINSYFDEDDDIGLKMPPVKKSTHFKADDDFQIDEKEVHQKPFHLEKSELKIAKPQISNNDDTRHETPHPAPAPQQIAADLISKKDEEEIKAKEKARAEAEAKRLEAERVKRQQDEKIRLEAQKQENEKKEHEKAEEEKRLEATRTAQENALKEQQAKNSEEEKLAKQLSETEERIKKEAEKIKAEEAVLEQKLEEIQAQEKKLEEDRIAREKAAEEARIKALEEAKRAEQERIAKQKADEEAQKKRLEEERLNRERAEAEAKKKAEEAKRLEEERIAREKAQQEAQIKAQAEAKRLDEEKAAREKLAREKSEAETKRLEEERIAKLKAEAEAKIRAEIEEKVRAEFEQKMKEEAEKRRKIEEQLAKERAVIEQRKIMLQKEREEAEKQVIDKTIKESVAKTFSTNQKSSTTTPQEQAQKIPAKQSDNVSDLQDIINNAASQISTTPHSPSPTHSIGPKVNESMIHPQTQQATQTQIPPQAAQSNVPTTQPVVPPPVKTVSEPPVDEYGGVNNDAAFQQALEQLKSIPYGNQPPATSKAPEIIKVESTVVPQKAVEKQISQPTHNQMPQAEPKRAVITPIDTGSEEFEMPHLPSHQLYPDIKENLPKIETIKPEAVTKPEAPAEPKSQPFIPPVVKRTFETAIKPGESKNVRSVAKSDQLNAGFPQLPDIPNIVLGIIKDPRGRVLPNVLVEIMNNQGVPVRAFKTNGLGQFTAATPLADGEYDVVLDDPRKANEFENIHIKLEGKIFQPLEIFSIDAREKLRRELFGGQKVQQAA